MKFGLLFMLLILNCFSVSRPDNNIFEGQWDIVKMYGLKCNDCPTIVFGTNNVGTIIYFLEETSSFQYKLHSDSIFIHYTDEDHFFGNDTVFHFTITKDEDGRVMEWTSVNNAVFKFAM